MKSCFGSYNELMWTMSGHYTGVKHRLDGPAYVCIQPVEDTVFSWLMYYWIVEGVSAQRPGSGIQPIASQVAFTIENEQFKILFTNFLFRKPNTHGPYEYRNGEYIYHPSADIGELDRERFVMFHEMVYLQEYSGDPTSTDINLWTEESKKVYAEFLMLRELHKPIPQNMTRF